MHHDYGPAPRHKNNARRIYKSPINKLAPTALEASVARDPKKAAITIGNLHQALKSLRQRHDDASRHYGDLQMVLAEARFPMLCKQDGAA